MTVPLLLIDRRGFWTTQVHREDKFTGINEFTDTNVHGDERVHQKKIEEKLSLSGTTPSKSSVGAADIVRKG
jgi:hypothetical protein